MAKKKKTRAPKHKPNVGGQDERIKRIAALPDIEDSEFIKENEKKIERWRPAYRNIRLSIEERRKLKKGKKKSIAAIKRKRGIK